MNTTPGQPGHSMHHDAADRGASPSAGAGSQGSRGAAGKDAQEESIADEVAGKAKERAEQVRESAASKVDKLADSVAAAASELRQDDVGHLSQHIQRFASGMHRVSDAVKHKSADELVRDVNRLAREHPALFIGGGLALGFALTRFAKASARDRSTSDDGDTGARVSGASSPAAHEVPSAGSEHAFAGGLAMPGEGGGVSQARPTSVGPNDTSMGGERP